LKAESRVNLIMPGYKTPADYEASKINFTVSLCEDNSALIKNVAND